MRNETIQRMAAVFELVMAISQRSWRQKQRNSPTQATQVPDSRTLLSTITRKK